METIEVSARQARGKSGFRKSRGHAGGIERLFPAQDEVRARERFPYPTSRARPLVLVYRDAALRRNGRAKRGRKKKLPRAAGTENPAASLRPGLQSWPCQKPQFTYFNAYVKGTRTKKHT